MCISSISSSTLSIRIRKLNNGCSGLISGIIYMSVAAALIVFFAS